MADNVFLILQDNEDARPIVEAVAKDNADVNIKYEPGMVRMESPGRLVVMRDSVTEFAGREWDIQELHLNLVSLSGNLDEDDDHFTLAWG